MKYVYFFVALALLTSCNPNSKKTESSQSVISNDSLTAQEAEYLKTRDTYIEQFKQFEKSPYNDSVSNANSQALLNLEARLREILKGSRYSGQGKINLEVLIPSLGFGMLDGLWFEKDSMRIFYTSKNLFLKYFNSTKIENLIPENLEVTFQTAFASDAFIMDCSHIKISSAKSTAAYGMVGLGGQDIGPYPPQILFAFVSTDKFVYLSQKFLKEPIKQLPQCKSVWDSFGARPQMSIAEQDTAFVHFCKCYQKELSSDPQFESIQKQLESMVMYLEP
jgi:hypothetical protein